jgi:hypothetical protein
MSDVEANALIELNKQIGEMEQQGVEALTFFNDRLSNQLIFSDQLIFRRASGKVVGKSEFLANLKNNPFSSRRPEEISVTLLNDRALVTLIVIGTRVDDGSVHRYRNIRLFSRSAGRWVLELWYNYEITGL